MRQISPDDSCLRWLHTLFAAVALIVAAAPAQGSLTWRDVCDELSGYQHYGVQTMIDDCQAASETCEACDPTCRNLWADWVACRQNGGNPDACKEARVAAMACKVCDQGIVDANGADQVFFVNPDACNLNNPPGGATPSAGYTDPYCTLGAAVVDAYDDQIATPPLSTKIAVCPAVYRETVDEIVPTASSAPPEIIVESVVQHEAIVSGSEEWSIDWQPASPPNLAYQNLLPYSEDFQTSTWDVVLNDGEAMSDSIPGPFGPNVMATEIQPHKDEPVYLVHSGNGQWGTGRYVLSVYVKVKGRAHVGFLLGDLNADTASYSVTLPPGPCTVGPVEGADGFGYEVIEAPGSGDLWYRLWVADSLLTDAEEEAPYTALNFVRIDIDDDPGYTLEYGKVWVWGAQLEHRPVGSFATEPRDYVATSGGPASGTMSSFSVYENTGWTKDWGTQAWDMSCPGPEPTMLRRELMFEDGEPLLQVLNKDDMVPGTFFIDDGLTYQDHTLRWPVNDCPGSLPKRESQCDESPCSIFVAPHTEPVLDTDAGYYIFEQLEVAERTRTFWLQAANHWTVRGLRFTHAAGELLQGSSAYLNGHGLTFTDNLAEHNSGTGFGISGLIACKVEEGVDCDAIKGIRVYAPGTYLARNRAFDNGILGAGVWFQQDLTVEDEHYARNNWRGLRVGHFGGFVGGTKMGWIDGGNFSNLLMEDNYGNGLWFDHYGLEIDINHLTAVGNQGAGLFFERHNNLIPSGYNGLSSGLPATHTFRVNGGLLANNRVGLRGSDAVHVKVSNATFQYNHDPSDNGAQVAWVWTHFLDDSSPEGLPNGLHDWTMVDNTYAACSSDVFYDYSDDKAGLPGAGAGSTLFHTTLDSGQNVFEAHPSLTRTIGFRNTVTSILNSPPPAFNLDIWRSYTTTTYGVTQDLTSCVVGEPGC